MNQAQTDREWNVSWGGQPQPWSGHSQQADSAMCADACSPMESAVTPETRLAAAVGGWVREALHGEGLVLVERGSTRNVWLDALRRASRNEPAAVPALIDAGARQGWLV